MPQYFFRSKTTKFRSVKGRHPAQQFIEQHAEGINVAPRVHIARAGLFRTHVSWRSDELMESREERPVGERLRGLGDAEIYYFWNSNHSILSLGDQNI